MVPNQAEHLHSIYVGMPFGFVSDVLTQSFLDGAFTTRRVFLITTARTSCFGPVLGREAILQMSSCKRMGNHAMPWMTPLLKTMTVTMTSGAAAIRVEEDVLMMMICVTE